MREFPHGCDHDAEQERIAIAEREAHEAGECRKGCVDCEDEEYERNRPVCQDCGEKALPGYVAGDRCARAMRGKLCGGRLDKH